MIKKLFSIIILFFIVCSFAFEEAFPDVTPLVYDITGDGHKEIIFGYKNGLLRLFDSNGEEIITGLWPRHLAGAVQEEVKVFDNGIKKSIVVSTYNGKVYSIDTDGKMNWRYDSFSENEFFLCAPTVDASENSIYFASTRGEVHSLDVDGNVKWRFPAPDLVSAPIILTDLNGNGNREIVFKTDSGTVYAFDNNFKPVQGWPIYIEEAVNTSMPYPMTIKDIDSNGYNEIIMATNEFKGKYTIYTINHDGTVNSKFTSDTKVYEKILLIDIDNDGVDDVVYFGLDGYIYARDVKGKMFPGFPHYGGKEIRGGLKLIDVNGDGKAEIVAVVTDDFNNYKTIFINSDGNQIKEPYHLGKIDTNITFADVDGNGVLEIVCIVENKLNIVETDITVPIIIEVLGVEYEY